nr:MAG TPA: hypothetical protein [Caudoviricetes sp.]
MINRQQKGRLNTDDLNREIGKIKWDGDVAVR